MKRNILCILISLAVLSSCAYLIGDQPWQEIAIFNSTFNKVPIQVELTRPGHELAFEAMDIKELKKYWDIYEGRFVRFTGVIHIVHRDYRTEQIRTIVLSGYPYVHVSPRNVLTPPETYEEGATYEFTGFLVRYEEHRKNQLEGQPRLRLYAFQIQHLEEKK